MLPINKPGPQQDLLGTRIFIDFDDIASGTAHQGLGFKISNFNHQSFTNLDNLGQAFIKRTTTPHYMAIQRSSICYSTRYL